jgi:branched-chain amino acid transport system substrate-binding protein
MRLLWRAGLTGIVLVASVLTSISLDIPTAEAKTTELAVGIVVPLTGPDAEAGITMKNAATLALEDLQYKAGGHKLNIHWIDEGDSPATATSNYEKAIVGNRLDVGLFGWRSDAAVAMIPLVAKYKLPHLFGFGATGVINEKIASDREQFGYWTTKFYPSPQNYTGNYAYALQAAADRGIFKPKSRSVALYAEDTDWGRSTMEIFTESFKKVGWDIKSVDFFPVNTVDFAAYLAKVKSLDVDVLAGTAGTSQTATSLVKQFKSSGLNSLLVVDTLGYVANWYDATGPASDGVLDEGFIFTTPEAKQFSDRYKDRYGQAPSPVAGGLAYDAIMMFAKVIEAAAAKNEDLNAQTIYDTIKQDLWTGKIAMKGIMNAEYKYTQESVPDPVVGQGLFAVPVVQYFSGTPVVIWPPESANAELKPPK